MLKNFYKAVPSPGQHEIFAFLVYYVDTYNDYIRNHIHQSGYLYHTQKEAENAADAWCKGNHIVAKLAK